MGGYQTSHRQVYRVKGVTLFRLTELSQGQISAPLSVYRLFTRLFTGSKEALLVIYMLFNDIIFYPITDCLLKRLQRIQFAAASFVFGRYVNNIDSILKLGWLPMKERREWHVLKAAHEAIYSHYWPRNLQLEQVRHARN